MAHQDDSWQGKEGATRSLKESNYEELECLGPSHPPRAANTSQRT